MKQKSIQIQEADSDNIQLSRLTDKYVSSICTTEQIYSTLAKQMKVHGKLASDVIAAAKACGMKRSIQTALMLSSDGKNLETVFWVGQLRADFTMPNGETIVSFSRPIMDGERIEDCFGVSKMMFKKASDAIVDFLNSKNAKEAGGKIAKITVKPAKKQAKTAKKSK